MALAQHNELEEEKKKNQTPRLKIKKIRLKVIWSSLVEYSLTIIQDQNQEDY